MNYTYIFIMILVLIIIYGLLFRIKNNKIINTIESFETNLPNIDELYESSQNTMLDGKWTSIDSKLFGDTITDTITINMKKDKIKSGKIGQMKFSGNNFDIQKNSTNKLSTNEIKGNSYLFNFNPDYESYRLPFDVKSELKNIPILEMINLGSSSENERSLIFKFVDGKLNSKAKAIISNNNNSFKSSTPKINGIYYNSSSVIRIDNYKFKHNALEGEYISLNDLAKNKRMTISQTKNMINEIKKKYNNIATFQLKRNFHFANEQTKETPFSRMYNMPIIKDEQILVKLKHNKIFSELAENKLATKFYNVTTFVYFHKCTKSEESFGFAEPRFYLNQNELKLKNQAQNHFNNYIYAPNLKSVTRTINSDFNPKLIGTINTYDKNDFKLGVNTISNVSFSY